MEKRYLIVELCKNMDQVIEDVLGMCTENNISAKLIGEEFVHQIELEASVDDIWKIGFYCGMQSYTSIEWRDRKEIRV